MKRGTTGHREVTITGDESVRAFVPAHLPPVPPLAFEGRLQRLVCDRYLAILNEGT